jgi:phage shock protein C
VTEATPPRPPPLEEQPRVLRRPSEGRVLGGVCAGLGPYLGLDPVLLRIAFVVLGVAGGSSVLLYVLGWILIPEAQPGEPLGTATPSNADTTRLIVGGALIAVGTVLLLGLSLPRIGKYLWPLALIVIGVAVILQSSMSKR